MISEMFILDIRVGEGGESKEGGSGTVKGRGYMMTSHHTDIFIHLCLPRSFNENKAYFL